MADYRVIWEIDIDADSPREAAEKAREIQLRPHSIATLFNIIERKAGDDLNDWSEIIASRTVEVDLNPEEA
jgi:hypothetical protein